jgi:hypothetical protein
MLIFYNPFSAAANCYREIYIWDMTLRLGISNEQIIEDAYLTSRVVTDFLSFVIL